MQVLYEVNLLLCHKDVALVHIDRVSYLRNHAELAGVIRAKHMIYELDQVTLDQVTY